LFCFSLLSPPPRCYSRNKANGYQQVVPKYIPQPISVMKCSRRRISEASLGRRTSSSLLSRRMRLALWRERSEPALMTYASPTSPTHRTTMPRGAEAMPTPPPRATRPASTTFSTVMLCSTSSASIALGNDPSVAAARTARQWHDRLYRHFDGAPSLARDPLRPWTPSGSWITDLHTPVSSHSGFEYPNVGGRRLRAGIRQPAQTLLSREEPKSQKICLASVRHCIFGFFTNHGALRFARFLGDRTPTGPSDDSAGRCGSRKSAFS